MTKSKVTAAILLSGMLFVILFSHLPVLYTVFYHEITGANKAEAGVMNVNNSALDKKFVLDGE